ncbi:hypothetical protein LTR95_011544 [Oleoguttula sp. CCFEE 5521]
MISAKFDVERRGVSDLKRAWMMVQKQGVARMTFAEVSRMMGYDVVCARIAARKELLREGRCSHKDPPERFIFTCMQRTWWLMLKYDMHRQGRGDPAFEDPLGLDRSDFMVAAEAGAWTKVAEYLVHNLRENVKAYSQDLDDLVRVPACEDPDMQHWVRQSVLMIGMSAQVDYDHIRGRWPHTENEESIVYEQDS